MHSEVNASYDIWGNRRFSSLHKLYFIFVTSYSCVFRNLNVEISYPYKILRNRTYPGQRRSGGGEHVNRSSGQTYIREHSILRIGSHAIRIRTESQ